MQKVKFQACQTFRNSSQKSNPLSLFLKSAHNPGPSPEADRVNLQCPVKLLRGIIDPHLVVHAARSEEILAECDGPDGAQSSRQALEKDKVLQRIQKISWTKRSYKTISRHALILMS